MDFEKLKKKILEKGYSIPKLAKEIGIDRSTFYRKSKANSNGFSVKEVKKISSALELSYDDVNGIFFNSNIA